MEVAQGPLNGMTVFGISLEEIAAIEEFANTNSELDGSSSLISGAHTRSTCIAREPEPGRDPHNRIPSIRPQKRQRAQLERVSSM